ncbi:hypothetical protein MTE2_4067 [Klebsiella pneumoniae VA360]|nr:hypothetical protein MTE2_4067 [Klebsiella pneumoniae VA360]
MQKWDMEHRAAGLNQMKPYMKHGYPKGLVRKKPGIVDNP